MNNQFLGYESRYSGAFDLQDTFKTQPRMCAKATANLTNGVNYYRAKNEVSYLVGVESSDGTGVINQMDKSKDWLFQNGSSAELLGYFSEYDQGGTFYISTDNEDDVGKHRTILRGCSRTKELVEAYLYVEVYNNKFPDFVSEVSTTFAIDYNDTVVYSLPDITDSELGDPYYSGTVLVSVEADLDPENEYPPFMSYDSTLQELTFRPESNIWYKGKTWTFRIIIKESDGSDSVKLAYQCYVTINGDVVDMWEVLDFTDYTFFMGDLDRYGATSITWSNPVNTTYIWENWDAMFDVYVKNVTIREHNQTMPVLDW
jgi:hypothetical protein